MTPIAIVGRACVLPGALSPEELWQAVIAGRDLTSSVPAGRWGLDPASVLCRPDTPQPDHCWSDRGGFVRGFEQLWNPQGFDLPAAELDGLDPLIHWTLHCAREALGQIAARTARIGLVLGNLGFPSESMARFADQVWKDQTPRDPRHRAMSGGSAALIARALGLTAGSYSLDAACASSLYALKLACDQLNDGEADLMLAGAVQRADPLFLQQGFAALGALSKSGQSRPFHRDADGLVAAEGCALFALKRLADARRDGERIHAVIRGIGLCNDGRGRGLLVPDENGQRRAMQQAYRDAGLRPEQVSLLECHATGTPVGDAAELRSSAAVFARASALPIASLKSNLGHLITAAGGAGIIKLIEALRHRQRPPNRAVDRCIDALAQTPFRLLEQLENWPAPEPRIAAISAFGFGGNNAHLVLSEDDPGLALVPADEPAMDEEPVAIVGLECSLGRLVDAESVAEALFSGASVLDSSGQARADQIELDLAGLRFPPRDLEQTLPQQLLLLRMATAALAAAGVSPGPRVGALIGMEPDAEVARYGTRWRLPEGADREAVVAPLQAASVLGCMPNIPANRLSSQFDLGGPSYTLQAGAQSGLQALAIARRALLTGEQDAVLVGAVDLCCEPVTMAAGNTQPADAAVALVLKRLADAKRDGDRIHALLDRAESAAVGEDLPDLRSRCGDAGAADGLLRLAVATLCLHHRRRIDGLPWLSAQARSFEIAVPGHAPMRLREAQVGRLPTPAPQLHLLTAAGKAELIDALAHGSTPAPGPARLALVATETELAQVRARALAHLRDGAPAGSSVHFRERPLAGELAFVFAGAGASYAGMGRELLQAFPTLLDSLGQRSRRLSTALDWSLAGESGPSAVQQLWAASALSQLHLALSTELLGLHPDAWIGYSSGETNALVAAEVWTDPDALMNDMDASALVTRRLGGDFETVAAQWGGPVHWASWTVLAPVAEVRAAIEPEPQVHLAIINADADCLIAGDTDGCARVVERIGSSRCLRLDYPLAVHVPELQAVAEDWLQLHRRDTRAPRCGRIYSTASGAAYTPDREFCAQAILAQANQTLDLRPVVLQAWNDGVRVFVEHGPGNSFARAIRNILGPREALMVSLDRRNQGLEGVLSAAAALWVAGIDVDMAALQSALAPPAVNPTPKRPMRFAAHWPEVRLQRQASGIQTMWPAPPLPSVFNWSATVISLSTVGHVGPQGLRDIRAPRHVARYADNVTYDQPQAQPPLVAGASGTAGASSEVGHVGPQGLRDIQAPRHVARYADNVTYDQPQAQAPLVAGASGIAGASSEVGHVGPQGLPDIRAPRHLARYADDVTYDQPQGLPEELTPSRFGATQFAAQHQFAQLTQAQLQYVQTQSTAQNQFLALQARAQSLLFANRAAAPWVAAAANDLRAQPGLQPAGVTRIPAVSTTLPTMAPAASDFAPTPATDNQQPTTGSPSPPPTPTPTTDTRSSVPATDNQQPTTRFTRAQLEIHADSRISEIFGAAFAAQDSYARQVRMPKPPLLLADRVLAIEGAPGVLARGRIVTETDVAQHEWAVHCGRLAAGVLIECGQADLMLVSWQGIDAHNRGERVYRLLGCELMYHGDLPARADTLRFDIELDGHAAQGDVRLMFFHYDCHNGDRRELSVRQGQAGFFTAEELAASAGCLWSPEQQAIVDPPQLDAVAVACTWTTLDRAQLEAFAAGQTHACFGPGFELARTHTRSPAIQGGRMLLLDRVSELAIGGGPWGRGYLRAELDIHPQQWFFDGHFKNDPCMPGTLMFEACLQAMALYLAACGYTLKRDGWRFQPVPELSYALQCRGQVTPGSRLLVTEVFVEERVAGPRPTLYADLLCTVDGLKAFHARRVALELVPDWPLEDTDRRSRSPLRGQPDLQIASDAVTHPNAPTAPTPPSAVPTINGFPFDQHSLLACALGRPSAAFGPMYRRFDGPTRVARLPSPPYHFISRIAHIEGPIGVMRGGARVIAEYEVPEAVWYLDENGTRVMPFAVLLEAALQPCGWLSSYVGSALTVDSELGFRNLDGEGTVLAELPAAAGTLTTEVELTDVSASAGMIIENFRVRCHVHGREVYQLKTVFGFFPPEALAAQAGLPVSAAQRELLTRRANVDIGLAALMTASTDGVRLPGSMLRMIDRIEGHWPEAGAAGLGQLRAVKDIDSSEWFFKAHFFQDPVQPGSLGLEAMLQTLQYALLQHLSPAERASARFQSIALDQPHRWKYRGQVLPHHLQVHTTLELTELRREGSAWLALADASLWVDGQRIYEATGLGVRAVLTEQRLSADVTDGRR
ncbi:MAG: beta-ketoacyl synthase N-terminal-like domain-containing protein [Lysobacterales bacterium]